MKKLCLIALLGGLGQLFAQNRQEGTLLFNVNSAALSPEARNTLEIMSQNRQQPAQCTQVMISGHTDSDGGNEFNLALSRRRAQTVQQFLIKQGFPQSAIRMDWQGEERPLGGNEIPEGKEVNRRVEVEFVKAPGLCKAFGFDVEWKNYEMEAGQEATLLYPVSGTVVRIPANSLLNERGEKVKGRVTYSYREWRDPAEFLASGIPMDYPVRFSEYHFNSGGMFELRAWQDGKELRLAPGKRITTYLVGTENLPGLKLFSYDENEEKWAGPMLTSPLLQDRRFENPCLLPKCPLNLDISGVLDTLKAYRLALRNGSDLALFVREKNFGGNADPRPDFEARYRDLQYAGVDFIGKPEKKAFPNRIKLKPRDNFWQTKADFTLSWSNEFNPELAELRAMSFGVRLRGKTGLKARDLRAVYADVRLGKNEGKDGYFMELKSPKGIIRFPVKIKIPGFAGSKKALNDKIEKAWLAYQSKLEKRAARFAAYQKAGFYETFRQLSQISMSDKEKCMKREEWENYFRANKQEMQARYDRLLAQLEQDPEKAFRQIRGFAAQSTVPEGGPAPANLGRGWQTADPNLIWNPVSGENEDERRANEMEIWNKYQAAIRAAQIPYTPDPGHTFPSLIRELSLGGFGIHNSDQVLVLGQSVTLQPQFRDEAGNPLKGHVLSLVDYNINGAMSFDPNRFMYNPKSKNAFLLFMHDGRKFFYAPEKVKALQSDEGPYPVLVMDEITDDVKDLKDLKGLLGLR